MEVQKFQKGGGQAQEEIAGEETGRNRNKEFLRKIHRNHVMDLKDLNIIIIL